MSLISCIDGDWADNSGTPVCSGSLQIVDTQSGFPDLSIEDANQIISAALILFAMVFCFRLILRQLR